jgi:hypothetical protein
VCGVLRGQPRSSKNQISWLEVKHTLQWPATGKEHGCVCQMKKQRVRKTVLLQEVCSLRYAMLWAVIYRTQQWMWPTVLNLTMLSVWCGPVNETGTFTFHILGFNVAWHHPI